MSRVGHVLIAPKRVVPRFGELSVEEVQDLWGLAQQVGTRLQRHHKAEALTLTIQVHLLPRRSGDFEPNDKVYDAIDEAAKEQNRSSDALDLDAARTARSPGQMAAEAAELRPLFQTADGTAQEMNVES